ncbi:hypothetical protein ILUMI_14604 [Ignelater luminosus]|uniref:Uncharacterized protein n=1 Tax=Ignelater luminosus TaxID=2038154 RepID=A0A8K0G9V9_IGNLU|nr:hypothetical protein ILUMI_14604 [Ignelater luminosus]
MRVNKHAARQEARKQKQKETLRSPESSDSKEDAASAELVMGDDDNTNLETDHPEDKNVACLFCEGLFSQDLRERVFSKAQNDCADFESFLKELKLLSKNCEFEDQESSLIKDRIAIERKDLYLQQKILNKFDLNLQAEDICGPAEEILKIQAWRLQGDKVDAIRSIKEL